ncbi:hybrid sensor histidine kinase/response regulator [Nostoc linckia]|uniref:hybrid sensor histidine kinase/response regulator n=1 Tax=Nostoc linckia TaxID=92942 RepID=UPI000BFFED92|nr:ATP-binding protein [Nostoc linckia]
MRFKSHLNSLKEIRQNLAPYIIALLTVTISLLLSVLLSSLLKPTMFMLFFVAVAISAWYGGMEAGLLATALSTVVIDYFFIEPLFTLFAYRIDSIVHLCVFLIIAIIMSCFHRQLRIFQQRLEKREKQLQVSEAKFRHLVESNIIGVFVSNSNGEIIEANEAFLKMLGYSREEILVGRVRWQDLTLTEDLALSEHSFLELEATKIFPLQEKEYCRKDGSSISILIGGTLLREADNNQEEVISFCLDISKRKQAEQEREQLLKREQAARSEAEAANRIKDEFLAVLSHEIRSPLNPILGWSQLLQSKKLDEVQTAQALEVIERNAQLQAELIDDLLDISRILRGKLNLNIRPVDLGLTIQAAIEIVRLAAQAKSIQIQTMVSTNTVQVLGDPSRLQQVIWNLLSNAVKFTEVGGRIEIRLERLDSQALITVSDTGKGIHPDFLPYVFDYFRQADSTTTRRFGGLGLGLAIVRHLVELHGGTVEAQSQGINHGATFIVRLPLMPTQILTKQDSKQPEQSLDLKGIKILVVEDDTDTREFTTCLLEEYGASVTAVTSASEALITFGEFQPDLLLSDIGMPDIDGYMLMQQVRTLPPEQGGKIPAIALTAYAGEFDYQQALRVGFQRHISKPVKAKKLVEAITDLVGVK